MVQVNDLKGDVKFESDQWAFKEFFLMMHSQKTKAWHAFVFYMSMYVFWYIKN